MNIVQKIRWRLGRMFLKRATTFSLVPTWVTASFFAPIFGNLVNEAYKKNSAFFACVSAFGFLFPEPPLIVSNKKGPLGEHKLISLLNKPNKLMGQAELMAWSMAYMAIGGNVYWHKVRNAGGEIIALWPYHDGYISAVPGGPLWVQEYEYHGGMGEIERVPTDDIIHIKWPMPDPDEPWRGQAPLVAAAREVQSDNEATRYLKAILQNDAMPRVAINAPADRYLQDDEVKRMKAQWAQEYGGDNRGKVAVMEGGATATRLSLDLQEMAFAAVHEIPEARIAAVMRVPPIVAGLNIGLNRSTYSNYGEARKSFTEETLVALWRIYESEMLASLAPEFGDSLKIEFDLSKVRALREDTNALWARVDKAFNSGYLGLKESRQFLKLPSELPQDDLFKVSSGGYLAYPKDMAAPPKDEEAQGDKKKGIETKTKRKRRSISLAKDLRRIRVQVANRMKNDLDEFFGQLAKNVAHRFRELSKASSPKIETKEFPSVEDLLGPDQNGLNELFSQYYGEVLEESWETWNQTLGLDIDFSLGDPAVIAALEDIPNRTNDILEATWQTINDMFVEEAESEGWSIEEVAERLVGLVEETYKNRHRSIARTEMGTAQNRGTTERYRTHGLTHVLVLDNGFDNSHENCKALNRTVQTLKWAEENPLEHPNCVRAFAPHFADPRGAV